jgi:hypothetical protein
LIIIITPHMWRPAICRQEVADALPGQQQQQQEPQQQEQQQQQSLFGIEHVWIYISMRSIQTVMT